MVLRLLVFGILFLSGCDFEFHGREVELIPGMTWKYCSLQQSRVFWDKYGVIAEGNVFISFYEYGFSFCYNGRCKYVDVVHNVLVPSAEELGAGMLYSAMDASSAVGIFSREAHVEFCKEMTSLMARLEKRRISLSKK